MTQKIEYLSLKLSQAPKAGLHAKGQVSYRVLSDVDRQQLFLTLVGNEGGGWFSTEIVPLVRVEAALAESPDDGKPLPSSALRHAFVSRSVNNAGFLAAVLRAEGLFEPSIEAPSRHVRGEDWDTWKQVMLSEPGDPYTPEAKKQAALPAKGVALDNSPSDGKKRKKVPSGGRQAAVADALEQPEVQVSQMGDRSGDEAEKPAEVWDAKSS